MPNIWDVEELAYRAMGYSENETDDFINANNDIDETLYDKYEISLEQYEKIVKDLIKFTPIMTTVITKKKVHVFMSGNRAIYTQDVS